MEMPFKIIVDIRTIMRGHASDFEVTLPETPHLHHAAAMYVNSASVTNTFSAAGTQIGATSHYVYWFEKLDTNAVFNRAALPERAYEATELASALQTALNAAAWSGDNLYTCTFDETRQTIKIARPSDGSRSFSCHPTIGWNSWPSELRRRQWRLDPCHTRSTGLISKVLTTY